MKKILIMIIGLFMIGTLLAQPGRNQNEKRQGQQMQHGKQMKPGPQQNFMDRLELTEPQKNELEKLRTTHLKSINESDAQIDIKIAELKAEVGRDNPTDKTINGLIANISELRENQFKSKVWHLIEVRALLDDTQKVKFDRMSVEMLSQDGPRGRGR